VSEKVMEVSLESRYRPGKNGNTAPLIQFGGDRDSPPPLFIGGQPFSIRSLNSPMSRHVAKATGCRKMWELTPGSKPGAGDGPVELDGTWLLARLSRAMRLPPFGPVLARSIFGVRR